MWEITRKMKKDARGARAPPICADNGTPSQQFLLVVDVLLPCADVKA